MSTEQKIWRKLCENFSKFFASYALGSNFGCTNLDNKYMWITSFWANILKLFNGYLFFSSRYKPFYFILALLVLGKTVIHVYSNVDRFMHFSTHSLIYVIYIILSLVCLLVCKFNFFIWFMWSVGHSYNILLGYCLAGNISDIHKNSDMGTKKDETEKKINK